MAESNPPIALVLAGGIGSRFWPVSTKEVPKQYLKLLGDRSLIRKTVDRIIPITGLSSRVYVCSTLSQKDLVERELPDLTQPNSQIIEPQGKNTAPCIMLSTLSLLSLGYSDSTPVVVLPSDHFIENEESFQKILNKAVERATQSGGLITLGITPDKPHTGYGYIQAGDEIAEEFFTIKSFVEKPNLQAAIGYFESGKYLWNSGIFIWTLGAISQAFQTHMPKEWGELSQAFPHCEHVYNKLPSIAIDVAIMEKTNKGFVIKANDLGWSDVGSWDAVYSLSPLVDHNAILSCNKIFNIESHGNLIKVAKDKQVALVGVENLIIIEEGNKLLIANRSKDQLVKKIQDM